MSRTTLISAIPVRSILNPYKRAGYKSESPGTPLPGSVRAVAGKAEIMTRPFQRARNVSLLEVAAKAMEAVKSLEVPREGLPGL